MLPERIKSTGRERTQAFQRQLCSESADLEICWNLALRFKHFELEPDSKARGVLDTDDLYVSRSAAPFRARVIGIVDAPADAPVGYSIGAVTRIAGPSSRTLHPKVTQDGDGLRLVEVYGRAYNFLDRLLGKHGL
jgi:hypothetical protein